MSIKQKHFSPAKSIMLGFFLLIVAGTFLLMLPVSSNDRTITSFWDALFTSTSAVCVTGLVVVDTYTHWSYFGQLIIVLLIQMGGMGIVTMTIGLAVFTGRKIGLKQRFLMQESISAPKIAGIIKLTGFIFRTTFMFESIGAILLSFRFVPKYGLIKGIWFAIFHSVSAFCNAGFDLTGIDTKYSSLTGFSNDPIVCITIMTLIVIGGIGFFVWYDIKNNGHHIKSYKLHTKIVLFTSFLLIVIPALYFFFYEFSFSSWGNMSAGEKMLASFFQSVTARTAGFNTVDLTIFKNPCIFILISLMLIGGSPGSTAGGFKTTTFAVLILCMRSTFNKKEHVAVFKRRIPLETLISVCSIVTLYIILFSAAGVIICSIDGVSLKEALFEAASAIGTVGLTLGITPHLSLDSRIILILLMYFGRVGGLTMIYAVSRSLGSDHLLVLPKEKISIG